MKNIYALAILHDEQRDIVHKVCFGSCGKILFGAANDPEFGYFSLCRTDAAGCPALDREMTEPMGNIKGNPVYLRKLKFP